MAALPTHHAHTLVDIPHQPGQGLELLALDSTATTRVWHRSGLLLVRGGAHRFHPCGEALMSLEIADSGRERKGGGGGESWRAASRSWNFLLRGIGKGTLLGQDQDRG